MIRYFNQRITGRALLTLAASALISPAFMAMPAHAKSVYYKDWDYFREEVKPGYRGIVADKQDGKVEDFRADCVYSPHLTPPTTEERLNAVRYGRSCKEPAAEPVVPPAPEPVAAPVETIKPVRDSKIVFFEYDKSNLTETTKMRLQSIIDAINSASEVATVKIAGHADRIGGRSKGNVALSKRRAEAVRDYLFKTGKIKSSVVDLEAYGASVPVTNCAKKLKRKPEIECLQADRRVEVIIEGLSKEVPMYGAGSQSAQ